MPMGLIVLGKAEWNVLMVYLHFADRRLCVAISILETVAGKIVHIWWWVVNGKEVDMRDLNKNMQPFKYATFLGEVPVYERDEGGNIVYVDIDGVQTPVVASMEQAYDNPVDYEANISAGKGQAQEEVFGTGISYSRTILTHDMNCPIDELTLLWIDSTPTFKESGYVDPNSADYKVTSYPAKGLDSIMFAIDLRPKAGE